MTVTAEPRLAYRPLEAAQVLGCSRDTVDRLITRGELRSFKVGNARFISAEELQRFIHERQAENAD